MKKNFQTLILVLGFCFLSALSLNAADFKIGFKTSVDVGSYLTQKAANGTGSFLSTATIGWRQFSAELIGENYIVGGGSNSGAKITGFQQGGTVNFSGDNDAFYYFPFYLKYRKVLNEMFSVNAGLTYSLFTVNLSNASLASYSGATSYTTGNGLGYAVGLVVDFGSVYLEGGYEIDRGSITYQGGTNSGLTFPLEITKFQISLGYQF
jgi:hypothetical protein